MTKYVRPRKTEKRGLRFSIRPEPFSPIEIERMGEKVKAVLANCHYPLSEEDQFLLSQIRLLCLFWQAKDDLKKRDELLRKINRGEDRGHRLGLTSDELRHLNRWVLNQDLGGNLEKILGEAKAKMTEVKK